jgi:hypothetical protein
MGLSNVRNEPNHYFSIPCGTKILPVGLVDTGQTRRQSNTVAETA